MKSRIAFYLSNSLGLVAFFWPFIGAISNLDFSLIQSSSLAIVVAIFAISIVAFDLSAGLMDSKAVAIVGVMTALIAALRLLGAGAIGVEPMWFLLILTARVFGARLGYAMGALSMAVSAFLTGGVGPWLSFQMFAAGWVALGVGIIPRDLRGKLEISILAIYGAFSSFLFGLLMDLQLWPWLAGNLTQLSFSPDLGTSENVFRYLTFHFATALSWDIPRAITTSVLILIAGPAIVHSLRRAEGKIRVTSHEKVRVEPSR